MSRIKPETATFKSAVDSIFNSEKEWLEDRKPSLCFKHDGHDIKIPWACLSSAGWSVEVEIKDEKFLEAIDGLLNHFKEKGTNYIDSDGNEGTKQ